MTPETQAHSGGTGTGVALVRSAASRVVALAVSVVVTIALLPIIVHTLGDRIYGAWVVVGTLLGYYGLLDLGLSSAVNRFVARALGRGDRREADDFIVAGTYLFAGAGAGVFLLAAAASLLSPRLVDHPEEAELFSQVIVIMGIAVGVSFPARCYVGVLTAHLRFEVASLIETATTLVRAAAIVVALRSGGGLLGLALVTAVTDLGYSAAIVVAARRIHGPTPLGPGRFSWQRSRVLLGYGFYTFWTQIADLVRQHTYPLVITSFLALEAVAVYAIAWRLRQFVPQLGLAVTSILTPVFSRQEGAGEQERLRHSFFFGYKIACYLAVYVAGLTAVAAGDFVDVWLGPEYADAVPLLWVLLVGSIGAVSQLPVMNLLYGISRNRSYAIANWCEALLNLAMSIWLVRSHGLMGVAIGAAVPMVLVKIFVLPISVLGPLDLSYARFLLGYTVPSLALGGVCLALSTFVAGHFLEPDYLELAVFGLISTLVYGVTMFVMGFSSAERNTLLSALRGAGKLAEGPSAPRGEV